MAIVTDQTITIHGVQVGISKPIMQLISTGDFTYEELSKFAFVGRHDFINDFIGIYASELQETGSASSLLAKNKYPAMNDPSQAWSTIKYLYTGKGERPYDAYGKMVLVYNRTSASSAIQSNYSDSNSACIVTDINPRLLKMTPNITHSTVTATYGEPGTYDIYDAEASITIKWYDDSSSAPFSTLCVQKYDEYEYFTFPLYDNRATSTEVISGNTGGTKARMYYMNDAFNRPGNKYISPWAQTDDIDDFASGASYSSTWNCVNKVNTDRANRNLILKYRGSPNYEGTLYVKAADLDAILKQCAGCGLYFEYNSTIYKPVVEGGIVTGYTDDLMHNSEWDLINDVSGNTIPDSPGGGGGGGDDEDEDTAISTAGAPFAKGLVNYYAMTAGSTLIDHISEALSTWDIQNTGKDLYKNLVSCKLIKPPAAIPTTGSEPFTIYGVKPQYQGADISLPVVSGNPDATFGPYSISRKFNDFRDYAPYTRVCIYLPYCGWCDLPSHVVGRSVTVKYFTDIIAATVRAVVFCNNNIIAEAAGVMGLDIPFTADAVGMKQAGVVSGLTAYAGGALQTAAGVASIVTTKGGKGIGETLSGASKLVSAYTQTAIAFNENTTEISGKNGDGCSLSGATNIIIKIIRPKYGASSTAPFVPAGFAHSVGFVSNKQVKVGNVSGLIIADNVDTSGIAGATDAERAEIKRVLESGLIVNAAPVP